MPYKTNKSFLAFLKNISPEKRKKKHFFFENDGLRAKFDLRLKKKQTNFGAISKLLEKSFVVAIKKKASHSTSMYGNGMMSVFLTKSFLVLKKISIVPEVITRIIVFFFGQQILWKLTICKDGYVFYHSI